jgi:cbb3-type cytochrome oxidase cytochrome c subunit
MTVPMEYRMTHITATNCSYEGPWLYGAKRTGPWVVHLDGKRVTSYFGNASDTAVSGHY